MNSVNFSPEFVKQIGIAGFFDIVFMALLIYSVLVLFKRTKAGFVLTGIIIISVIYLLARQFDLVLIATVLQGFFAVIIVALIVIFQDELRRFFEQLALWSLKPELRKNRTTSLQNFQVQVLTDTLSDFASKKIGALIVLPGQEKIDRHLEGGTILNGELSEPLMKSLFDPHSIGHDGAVVVDNDKISLFSVHLPLSRNFQQLRYHGTRHAAALGLAELTDALCLVVSEERGSISVARDGKLNQIGSEQLNLVLSKYYKQMSPQVKPKLWHDFFLKNYKEKVIALLMTIALWFVLVYGSGLEYKTFKIPIELASLQSNFEITDIDPKVINVTFLGPRRSFFLTSGKEISLILNIPNLSAGYKTVKISDSNLNFPKELTVEKIEPSRVRVKIDKKESRKIF